MCTPSSNFDKAMDILRSHHESRRAKDSTKRAKESVRKSTSSDDYRPLESHVNNTRQHVEAYSWDPKLVKSITSVPLAYTPAPLQSLDSIHSPLGNSIHNSASVAGMSIALHGVRVFKALIVVHAALQDGRSTTSAADEKVKDEFKFWMETIVHDVKYQSEGNRRYGKLAALYATYLKTKLGLSGSGDSGTHQHSSTWGPLYRSTVALRESLLSSIQEHKINGARCMALRLVLQDCLHMDSKLAISRDVLSEELAKKLGDLSLDVGKYDCADGVVKYNEKAANIPNVGKMDKE